MIRKIDAVLLSSPNAKKLAKFYTEKVGVKFQFEGEMGEGDAVFGASWKGSSDFMVMRQPKRYIVNFEVDDVEKEFKRLKKGGVKVIAPVYHIQDYGYIATFEDPDGNYFQLVQVREK